MKHIFPTYLVMVLTWSNSVEALRSLIPLPLNWMKTVGRIETATTKPTMSPALPLSPKLVNISGNQKGPIHNSQHACKPFSKRRNIPIKPHVLLTRLTNTPILAACSWWQSTAYVTKTVVIIWLPKPEIAIPTIGVTSYVLIFWSCIKNTTEPMMTIK